MDFKNMSLKFTNSGQALRRAPGRPGIYLLHILYKGR